MSRFKGIQLRIVVRFGWEILHVFVVPMCRLDRQIPYSIRGRR